MKVKVIQPCPTLCNPMDYTTHGILQARILEWVAILPGDFPNSETKPRSPALQVDSLPYEPPGKSEGFSSVQSLSRVLLFVTP